MEMEIEPYEGDGIVKLSRKKSYTLTFKDKTYKRIKDMQTCSESQNQKVNCPFQKQKKFTSRAKVKKPNYGCTYVPKGNSQIYCTTPEFRKDQYE